MPNPVPRIASHKTAACYYDPATASIKHHFLARWIPYEHLAQNTCSQHDPQSFSMIERDSSFLEVTLMGWS